MFGRQFSGWNQGSLRAIKPRRSHLIGAILLGAAIICMARSGIAQVLYGSVVGSVTDTTGAVVQGATVSVTDTQTNQAREANTGDSGTYKISTVPAGTYKLTISKAGFGDVVINDLGVTVNTDIRADAVMKPGTATETVTVSDQSVGLQTDRADISTQLTGKAVSDLPLAGRNFESLLSTVPGMTPPQDEVAMGSVNNPSRSMAFDGNGSSSGASDVSIEGVSSANSWITNLASYVPAQDSIQTVDVVTGSFNAEQGTAGGVSVNVQLKSGTNSFHGTAFEDYTGSALTSWPRFFDPTVLKAKPQLIEHQFGGTLGAPIIKNRLFGFVSIERLQDHEVQTSTSYTVPTPAARAGYFVTPIYDPRTGNADGSGRTTFPQVVNPAGLPAGTYYHVDSSLWDPATTIFLGAIPLPTSAGQFNNYFSEGPYIFNNTKYDAKVDYNATQSIHLNYRLSLLPFEENVPPAFGSGPASGPPVQLTGQPGTTTGNVTSNTLGGVYTISPHLVVDANVGYTYLKADQLPPLYGTNYGSDTLKIPNANGPDPINSGVPQFQIGGYFPWFGTWFSAIKNHNPNHTLAGNLTWVKGTHSLRFGANYSKVNLNIAASLFSYSDFNFNGGATSVAGGSTNFSQENGFADYLLGLTSFVEKSTLNTNWATERTSATALYAQDQWQVNHKVTVNYGVRWNYYPVPTRDHRGLEMYDAASNTYQICGKGGLAENCGVNVSPRLFSPLAGIAYRINDKMVVRAGGGINYEQQQMFRDGLQNYPGNTFYTGQSGDNLIPFQTVANGPLAIAAGTPTNGNPDGMPLIQKPDQTLASYPNPVGTAPFSLVKGDYKRGYIESWNLTVERELAKGWSGQVAYVGTQTVHEYADVNANVPSTIGGTVPYLNTLGFTAYNQNVPGGHSRYNSLQSTLRHRFQGGFMAAANYTWSKWMTSNGPLTPGYKAVEKSLSNEDRTHNFNINGTAELPFGKNKRYLNSGIGEVIAGGWQANLILTATSGTPFTVGANTNLPFGFGTQFADKVKAGKVPIHPGNVAGYFDTSYFAPPLASDGIHPTTTRFGTSGFNSLRGPGLFNIDAGLAKRFQIREHIGLQFRADAFNFTNTPHFNNPGAAPNNPSPSNISNGANAAVLNSVNPFGGRFGIDQRQIRLGVHIEF